MQTVHFQNFYARSLKLLLTALQCTTVGGSGDAVWQRFCGFVATGPQMKKRWMCDIWQPGNFFSWRLSALSPLTWCHPGRFAPIAPSPSYLRYWLLAASVVCLSVCPSVNFLRKSLLLRDKWIDCDQTCTRWYPGKRASSLEGLARD